MTTFTCPEGHESADPEWCDTCGSPIGPRPPAAGPDTAPTATVPSVGSPAVAAPGPSGPTVTCAHCGTVNEADALFCESCGFDFTTGQAPPPPKAPAVPPPVPSTSAGPTDFAVDVSVDPAWYALLGADSNEPCPPASTVRLPVRGGAVLIGRTSAEKAVNPEVALNDDPGVSRRHAQLVQAPDGTWSAVDQGSMNGTYVVAGGVVPAEPPTPIASGEPVPIGADDAVFVGAWSRITLIDLRPQTTSPTNPEPT